MPRSASLFAPTLAVTLLVTAFGAMSAGAYTIDYLPAPKPPKTGATAAPPALQPPPVPLPPAVKRQRESLYRLAMGGRFDALEAIARQSGPAFTFHFGFAKERPAAFWRAQARRGEDPLPKLASILRLPPTLDTGIYTFPAAATASASPSDWEALKTVYPPAKVARYRTEGYTGWRAGIDARGTWKFFIRGD